MTTANEGDATAQRTLAEMIKSGFCISINNAMAVRSIQLEAEQGDEDAQYSLAVWYLNNKGAPKDYAIAKKWLQNAVEQGHKAAILIVEEIKAAE